MDINDMAEFSKELLDMMTEFMICEVGARVLDGITYTILLKIIRRTWKFMKDT